MEGKTKNSWTTIHQLLIEGRILSSSPQKKALMVEYFDGLEYLVSLIIHNEDKTERFEEYLLDFCKEFNLEHIFNKNT